MRIRAVIQYRTVNGSYNVLSQEVASSWSFREVALHVLPLLPTGALIVALRFEAPSIEPEDVVLIRSARNTSTVCGEKSCH